MKRYEGTSWAWNNKRAAEIGLEKQKKENPPPLLRCRVI
jgi:hypothetical protein